MKKSEQTKIAVSVRTQTLALKEGRKVLTRYPVSTSRYGLGAEEGSMKTPLGAFRIAEKIGSDMPLSTVFKSRRPVKPSKKALRDDDLIMTRILWLEGLDSRNANTYRRFIYIHGTNHEDKIGTPASHGCVRMKNADVADLFERVEVGTPVVIRR